MKLYHLLLIVVVGLLAACGATAQPTSAPVQATQPAATATIAPLGQDTPAPAVSGGPSQVDEASYTTTASGLKYYDLKEGTGASPQAGQMVQVHYTGWLEDGTKFDSSVDRGEAFVFPIGLGQVIRGWDEGVASMKIGGKRQLVIPADLAYGAQGAGGVIPPNATLIFEVELLGVQ